MPTIVAPYSANIISSSVKVLSILSNNMVPKRLPPQNTGTTVSNLSLSCSYTSISCRKPFVLYRGSSNFKSLSLYTSFNLRSGVTKRSEEHTSELQSRENLVCRLLLEKKKICQRYLQ